MHRRSILGLAAAGALGPLAAPRIAGAQSGAWPTRGSVRLVAQFPPGGLVDTVSRLMAPALSQALGQTVVVENRAGAGGVIGTDFVAKQPADGYTLLVSHASVHVFSAATMPTLPFHPVNDFTAYGPAGRGIERAAGAQPVALPDAGPVPGGGAHAAGRATGPRASARRRTCWGPC